MKNKYLKYFLLFGAFFIYSFAMIMLKIAAVNESSKVLYLSFILAAFFILGCYAFLWQKVLKNFTLSFAMANKPVVLILSILWHQLIFKDALETKTIIGILVVLVGLVLLGLTYGKE